MRGDIKGDIKVVITLVSRWIHLCHSWMDLCQRRWLLALRHTSLPINGRRNSFRQKVKSTRTFSLWQIWKRIYSTVLFGYVLTVVCLSVKPGAVWPVPADQHVVLQHCRQTVSHTVVHELWSVRR